MRKIKTTIPFGWIASLVEDGYMVAVPLEQEMLIKAREYLDSCSLREVADWLSRSTDRKISHMGLKYIKEHDWNVIEEESYESRIEASRTTANVQTFGFPEDEEPEEIEPAKPFTTMVATYHVEDM